MFEIEYPEIEPGLQPRHRFMSAYEQRVEAPDKSYQYLLFAAEPYETIGFKVQWYSSRAVLLSINSPLLVVIKIPNLEVDKSEGRFFSNWDKDGHIFTLQLYFKNGDNGAQAKALPPPPSKPRIQWSGHTA